MNYLDRQFVFRSSRIGGPNRRIPLKQWQGLSTFSPSNRLDQQIYGYIKRQRQALHDSARLWISQNLAIDGGGYRIYDKATVKVPSVPTCKAPNCSNERIKLRNHGGYYPYCSVECQKKCYQTICALPDCSKSTNSSKEKSFWDDFCCKTHFRGGQILGIVQNIAGVYSVDWTKYPNELKVAKWHLERLVIPQIPLIFILGSISNKKLEEQFQTYCRLKKSPVERYFHGTSVSCAYVRTKRLCTEPNCKFCSIVSVGFDADKIQKDGPNRTQRYGPGFYLTPHPLKAHQYTGQGGIGTRAIIVCDVCTGKMLVTKEVHMPNPPKGYDCVYRNVPQLDTFFGFSMQTLMNEYPEICVFDAKAIIPRYVIVY